MMLQTVGAPFKKARATNATDTGFPSKVPTLTEPTGDGVIDLGPGGTPNAAIVVPYGTGDDNDVFNLRAIGWRSLGSGSSRIWIPMVLAEFVCTVSAAVGVAGGALLATERLCDTITLTTGNDDVSVDIVSPTGDAVAHAMFDLKGCEKLELTFDASTGDPTGMNALVGFL